MLGLIAFGQLKAFSHSVCFYFWRKTVPETVKPGTVPPKRPCPYLKRNRSSETFWRSRTHRVGHGRLIRRFHSSGTCVATPGSSCKVFRHRFGIWDRARLCSYWLLVTGYWSWSVVVVAAAAGVVVVVCGVVLPSGAACEKRSDEGSQEWSLSRTWTFGAVQDVFMTIFIRFNHCSAIVMPHNHPGS